MALVGTHWQCQPKEFESFVDDSLEYADQVKAKRLRDIGAFWVLASVGSHWQCQRKKARSDAALARWQSLALIGTANPKSLKALSMATLNMLIRLGPKG